VKQENKDLHNEVISLQHNMRNMVQGFSCTTSSFPLLNELTNEVSEFLKCDCQDAFFDFLSPELNLDGVVYFYKHCFGPIHKQLRSYFEPLYKSIQNQLCIESIDGPILNVLSKSYQNNWQTIFSRCFPKTKITQIMRSIQNTLKIADDRDEGMNNEITSFIAKAAEICFKMYISEPQIVFDLSLVGAKVGFS